VKDTVSELRICQRCNNEFVRRRGANGDLESMTRFVIRKFCSKRCAAVSTAFYKQWEQEHTAFLKSCLDDGMSHGKAAQTINDRYGTDYTRNAAIGKASRMGWSSSAARGKRPVKSLPIHSGGRLVARPKLAPRPQPLSAAVPKLPREEVMMRCVDVEPLNLSLIDLPSNGCRWPYGDGPHVFCGHPQHSGNSYCLAHARLSWRDKGVWERPDQVYRFRKLGPTHTVISRSIAAEEAV
jgi:GcrA cell cycle regulator